MQVQLLKALGLDGLKEGAEKNSASNLARALYKQLGDVAEYTGSFTPYRKDENGIA
jgi:hypothetical protein